MSLLPREFYTRDNVVEIAKDLLGKYIYTYIENVLTVGMIVETEAYCGRNDKACHAYQRRTTRTEIMYGQGGKAYVYLCYGIHHLFNIVTNVEGLADAVLIRAIEPKEGIDFMLARRNMATLAFKLSSGPGTLTQALGITTKYNGIDLVSSQDIWIEDKNIKIESTDILATPRVGIAYAQEDALLPWRFCLKNNPWYNKVVPKYSFKI